MGFLTAKLTDESKWAMRMLRELPDRMEAAQRELSYAAAELMIEELKRKAPELEGFGAWYEQLVVRRVIEGVNEMYVVGVPLSEDGELEEDELDTTLLSFVAKEGTKLTDEMMFLMETSPYPADMVPYQPPKGTMKVEARRVSEQEMSKVRENLEREWPAMRRDAKRKGIDIPEQPVSFGEQEVSRNLAFQVLRAEFGIGQSAQPHWRPAMMAVRRKFPELVSRIERTLTDPRYSGWRVPAPPAEQISGDEKRAVRDFQKFMP